MEVYPPGGPPGVRDGVPGPGQQTDGQGAGSGGGLAGDGADLPRDERQPSPRSRHPGGDVWRPAGHRGQEIISLRDGENIPRCEAEGRPLV